MKTTVEKRRPQGPLDYVALAVTTFGVGYIPGAPGTYGSVVGLFIYHIATFAVEAFDHGYAEKRGFSDAQTSALIYAGVGIALLVFSIAGIWASKRAIPLLGNEDPNQAVVDEVLGQLITFLFVPFLFGWKFILVGFIFFRIFDIWKPYPIDSLQDLPGGIGICADDIVAGVYAGICLSIVYAISLFI